SLLRASAVAGAIALCPALAQDAYPNKAVKILVGTPAGSFTDLMARLVADSLRAQLGQSFVIENRPGPAAHIATATVARLPNDGYTLLWASNSNTMNVSLMKDMPFDFARDFSPIAMVAAAPLVLVVNPALGVASVSELVTLAKAKPGELNFASTGVGSANHFAVELFNLKAGVKVTTVFYKGSPEGIADILAGRIHAMFSPASSVVSHIETGNLKALGVTSARRTASAPNVPTMAEAGLPGFDVALWNGLVAPAGTPADIVERLGGAALKAGARGGVQG